MPWCPVSADGEDVLGRVSGTDRAPLPSRLADIEHLGSAHTAAEVELLKAAARQKAAAGEGVLDLGLDAGASGGPLPVISSQMGCLVDVLSRGYGVLGLAAATGGDAARSAPAQYLRDGRDAQRGPDLGVRTVEGDRSPHVGLQDAM